MLIEDSGWKTLAAGVLFGLPAAERHVAASQPPGFTMIKWPFRRLHSHIAKILTDVLEMQGTNIAPNIAP